MHSGKNKKTVFLFAALFALYIALGVFAGLHHEPWADEGQSWLIARDNNSLIDIIKAVRYEGTFPTWSLIVKFFQLCGLKYEYIFVIPLIFSSIGVSILFMSDAPAVIKVFLPFSFYTVFQSAVIARQYSLVFPAMMLIMAVYKKRQAQPVRYLLALLFLCLTSSYGIIITGSFMLWDLICMINKKTSADFDKRFKLSFFAAAAAFLALSLTLIPPADASFIRTRVSFADSFVTTFLFHVENTVLQYVLLFLISALLIWFFRHDIIQVSVIVMPVILYMLFFYHRLWHTAYLFYLVIILAAILHKGPEDQQKDSQNAKSFMPDIALCVFLSLQYFAGLYSIYIDYLKPYSAAGNVAEFLTPYVESGKTVDMFGYLPFGVQPYFDSNIFTNYHTDKGYFIWNTSHNLIKLSEPASDVIISSEYLSDLYDLTGYESYRFPAQMIFKFSEAERSYVYVYVKEDLAPSSH